MHADRPWTSALQRLAWLVLACAGLAACGTTPTPEAQLGQTLRAGMQLQRIAPPAPTPADADQTTAREMREVLMNHMTGKALSQPALQAPLTGGTSSQ